MTLRWQDVKALVQQGLTDRQIAERLGYRPEYVGQVRRSIELKPNRERRGNE